MAPKDIHGQLQDLGNKLRDPLRLRLLVTAIALVVGYMGIFGTLDSKIVAANRKLRAEEDRSKLAEEVELLRAQFQGFEQRLQSGSDVNDWVQSILEGVRQLPLKLVNLDVQEERKVGPYRALVIRVNVEGEMAHLDQLLAWFETNERLYRIDKLDIEPTRNHVRHRSLHLTLLALRA